MKKKILPNFHEILYQLIQFRIHQFNTSKEILGIDYDSFMICSVVAAHFNFNNLKLNKEIDWDESWKLARSNTNTSILKKNKLTIFAVSQILNMPKESARRKVITLVKKKILKHTTRVGIIYGDKIENFKPFAIKEVKALSVFLKSLKKNNSLEQLLEFEEKDLG